MFAADLIIALKEAEHRPLIEQRFPEVESRVFGRRPDNICKPANVFMMGMIHWVSRSGVDLAAEH
jgi:hypothetical protein